MNQILNWLADGVLILLLGGTLVMALRLDRALRAVGGDRAAFEALIGSLGAATDAVKLGMEALRSEAERAAHQVERRCEDADRMATDLSFLIEAADRAGARLEQQVTAVPKAEADPAAQFDAVPDALPGPATADPEDPAKQRLARAAGRLRASRSYPRQARTDAAPEPAALPASEPVGRPPAAVPPDRGADGDAPAALRQLAGITTRRRVAEPADPTPAAIRDGSAAMKRDTHALPATHIKLVG